MAQSQYAQDADIQKLAITPAAYTRFEGIATGTVSAALQAASSIADSYLASQFTLPLQSMPQGWDMSLTMNVCWIACYLLYNQYGYAPMAPGDDMVAKRYEAAIKWLEQVRDEEIFPQFVDAAGSPPTSAEAGPYVVSDAPVGFTDRGRNADPSQYTAGSGCGPGGFWWWD